MTARETKFESFSYGGKVLHCESVALSRIADDVGTPVYVYSRAALVNRVRRLQAALENVNCSIHFAVKACSNIHILSVLHQLGCGADIVSGGELFRASVAQIPPEAIIFSGVGKTEKEIGEALKAGISMFNVESLPELFTIDRLASKTSKKPNISLRINPDVDAKTHPYISTGLKKNKFGLAKSELNEVYRHIKAGEFKNLNFCGLSCHIGSQILTGQPFEKSWRELLKTTNSAPFEVTNLDLGGGLGISYEGEKEISLENYGRLIEKVFKGTPYKLSIEPGRALVGPIGVLLTQLVSVKKRASRYFYVVDAAMNDLMRPALYGAVHPLLFVEKPKTRKTAQVDIVGPVCESSDSFQSGARFPLIEPDALLAFGNAGAYGMSMASQYNSRPLVAEVLVEGNSYQVIRRRETYADLIEKEL
jgi:diaminopimelate decarboxylase